MGGGEGARYHKADPVSRFSVLGVQRDHEIREHGDPADVDLVLPGFPAGEEGIRDRHRHVVSLMGKLDGLGFRCHRVRFIQHRAHPAVLATVPHGVLVGELQDTVLDGVVDRHGVAHRAVFGAALEGELDHAPARGVLAAREAEGEVLQVLTARDGACGLAVPIHHPVVTAVEVREGTDVAVGDGVAVLVGDLKAVGLDREGGVLVVRHLPQPYREGEGGIGGKSLSVGHLRRDEEGGGGL